MTNFCCFLTTVDRVREKKINMQSSKARHFAKINTSPTENKNSFFSARIVSKHKKETKNIQRKIGTQNTT